MSFGARAVGQAGAEDGGQHLPVRFPPACPLGRPCPQPPSLGSQGCRWLLSLPGTRRLLLQNNQEEISDFFFPPKHHSLDLQANEFKAGVSGVICVLESFLPHCQVMSCTIPQSPCRLARITGKRLREQWLSVREPPGQQAGAVCVEEIPHALPLLQPPFPGGARASARDLAPAHGGPLTCGMHGCWERRELA